MSYEVGQSFRALTPFSRKPKKVHIDVVFTDIHEETRIVYRVYGTRQQWWHYFVCTDYVMDRYVKNLNLIKP